MFVIVFAALIPLMAGTRPRETTPTTTLSLTGFPTTLPSMLSTEGGKNLLPDTITLISWDRACPDLKEHITLVDAVDNSLGLTGGSLELVGAETGFDQRYRVPGTTMKYQCSEGFDIGNGDNPVQSLTCTAGRKVDFSGLTQCRRKSLWPDLSF